MRRAVDIIIFSFMFKVSCLELRAIPKHFLTRAACLPTGLCSANAVSLFSVANISPRNLGIYWTNFHQIFTNGRYLVVDYSPDLLFFRPVA